MNVLFLILNKTQYLDDILSGFVEAGVKGATIVDSQGMGSALVTGNQYDVPLFGYLNSFLDNNKPYNKVIFTVVEDEKTLNSAIEVVQNILGDLSEPGVGLMFTVPVGNIYGMTDPTK